MDGGYGWASGEMMNPGDINPSLYTFQCNHDHQIIRLQKELKDTKAHRDGLSLALKDLRAAILLMLSVKDVVHAPEFAKVYNATEYNGCCTSCDRCLCIDAHPGCGCVDCGGTGYYSG